MNWVMLQKYSLPVSKRPEYLSYEERLRELSLWNRDDSRWRKPIKIYGYLMGENEEDGVRLFSIVPTDGMRTNEKTQNSSWAQKATFLLWGWWNIGTGSPKRLQSLHSQRYLKPKRTWPWASGSSWICLGHGQELDNLKVSHPTSVI